MLSLSFFRYFYKQKNFYYKERKATIDTRSAQKAGFRGVVKVLPSNTIDRSVNEDVMVGNLLVSNAMHKLAMCLKYLSSHYW